MQTQAHVRSTVTNTYVSGRSRAKKAVRIFLPSDDGDRLATCDG